MAGPTSYPSKRRAPRALAASIVALASVLLASYAVYAAVRHARRSGQGSLSISGALRVPLRPGVHGDVDARLTNRYPFDVLVTELALAISLDQRHRVVGCSATADFAVRQLPRSAYPLLVPARSSRTLSALGVRKLPRLAMVDRPDRDQDPCRGTELTLHYRAVVHRAPSRSQGRARSR